MTSRVYFGVIYEIFKIDHVIFKVTLFKCKHIDNNTNVETNELGFTQVDLRKTNYMKKSFNMASQAKQFVYH